MAFKNITSEKEIVEIQARPDKILADISHLGIKMDEALAEEKAINERIELRKKEEIELVESNEAILGQVDLLESKKDILEGLVESLEKEAKNLSFIEKQRKDIVDEINEKSIQLESLTHDISVEESRGEKINEKLLVKKQELEGLIEVLKQSHSDIKKEFESNKKKFEKDNDELFKLEALIAEKKNEASLLNEHIVGFESQLKNIEDSISTKSKELDILTTSFEKEQKKIEDLRIKKLEDLEKREKEIVEREGTCSIKEKWLEEKQKNLKEIKEELEKHFGRPIKNVIL